MTMRLVSWNVNGIRAVQRKGLFDPFVADLDPDVICLQEIKAEQSQADCDLSGYEQHWHSAAKRGYSGTAVFTRAPALSVAHGLPRRLATRHRLADDAFGNTNDEGRVITVEFEDFYLVTVYTPNAKGDLSRLAVRHQQWDPAFLAHVKSLQKKKPVAICGDLNVAHTPDDLANPKPNVGKAGFTDEERSGVQALLDAGFVDTFRIFTQGSGHYTWWSNFSGARERNVGWRIDYFLVSSDLAEAITAAEIHPAIMGSDHCPVSITLDLSIASRP
jgi:exodeoxyribonuclease-3